MRRFAGRRQQLSGAAFVVLISGHIDAYACQPAPGVAYDDPTGPNALIVMAEVTGIEQRLENQSSCVSVSYSIKEILHGSHEGPLIVSICIPGEEIVLNKTASDPFGFSKGALVLAGVTETPSPKGIEFRTARDGGLRYLMPTCWGPMHVNLTQLGKSERDQLVETFREELGDVEEQ